MSILSFEVHFEIQNFLLNYHINVFTVTNIFRGLKLMKNLLSQYLGYFVILCMFF